MTEALLHYLWVFLVGGAICAVGQILIDRTALTPARILVLFEVCGVFLTAVGLWDPVVRVAGAGATVPIVGFGYALARGVKAAVDAEGALGILSGGLSRTAPGIAAAVIFGLLAAAVSRSREK